MASLFKQRLTKILDDAELPEEQTERIEAFAKIFELKRHQVSIILNGKIPEDELLDKIAQEFEVKKEWLCGAENAVKNSKEKAKEPKEVKSTPEIKPGSKIQPEPVKAKKK